MPTYEYACRSCGQHVEVAQAFTDPPLTSCPNCGGELRKVFGNVGIVLKGSAPKQIGDAPSSGGAPGNGSSAGESSTPSTSTSSSSSETKSAPETKSGGSETKSGASTGASSS